MPHSPKSEQEWRRELRARWQAHAEEIGVSPEERGDFWRDWYSRQSLLRVLREHNERQAKKRKED